MVVVVVVGTSGIVVVLVVVVGPSVVVVVVVVGLLVVVVVVVVGAPVVVVVVVGGHEHAQLSLIFLRTSVSVSPGSTQRFSKYSPVYIIQSVLTYVAQFGQITGIRMATKLIIINDLQ